MQLTNLLPLFLAALLAFSAGCQKKEEPKGSPPPSPYPAQLARMQHDILKLQSALKIDPKNLGGWIALGNLLMDTARFHEAISAYQKALELDANNVNVRVDMGTCYRRIGMPFKAADEYRRAIAVNPRHPTAHRNLGVVLAFDFKQNEEAIKSFEEYLRLSPNAPDADSIRQAIARLKSGG